MTAVEPMSTGPLTRREILIVFIGLMTALFLSALDTNIVGVALPTIVGDLGGLQQIAWVGTAYLLTSTAATPLFGKFSDLYGRRRLFQVAIMVFVVGSLLCAISQTMTQLVLSRGVQGVGGGGIFAMAFAVIGDVVPATGARPLRGLLHVGVRLRQRGRPAARRVLRRQHRLALDLPHQRAPRGDRDGRDLGRACGSPSGGSTTRSTCSAPRSSSPPSSRSSS